MSLAHFPVEGIPSLAGKIGVRPASRIVASISYAKHAAILLISFLSVGLGWAGLYLAALLMGDNFHPVIPGELYRSAQPTAERIAEYQQSYGIKTIINLRGENTGSDWYDAEVEGARNLGITHIDFRMSARRELTMDQFNQIMDVLQKAEKPILVHCMSGSDRSGLISALYLAGIAKLGEAPAESQLSFRYGHIPLSISPSSAMDRSFEALEPVLGFAKP